ncbi:MAG: SDR family NAD(P)-dependent oxidoreductase, partial [Acetobacteraceae bacterium]|nr:SDR family NAD(P)-dependent oxidoreductase [Acetobacteraceae bacterium]
MTGGGIACRCESGAQRKELTQDELSLTSSCVSSLRPLSGSIALVTGASRGIGSAAAIELARLGAHVVITARTQGGLEQTDDAIRAMGGSATLLPLDLTEGDQVDAVGPSLYQRFGRQDVLVHAAGALGRLTPVPHILSDAWTEVLSINLSSAWRLIRSCDPLLRRAAAGRAVFVTDQRAREPKAYWGLYGATKAAMEHLVMTWAEEVRITPLLVNLFDPGPTATRLRSQAMPGEDPMTLPKPADVAPALAALCLPGERR